MKLGGILENFRIALLECPLVTMVERQVASDLFAQSLATRLRSYKGHYDQYSIPFDTTDIIADHLLVLDETEKNFKVVATMKIVSLDICQRYKTEFPLLGWLNTKSNALIYDRVKAHLDQIGDPMTVTYGGSFAIDPEYFLSMRKITQLIKVSVVKYFESKGIRENFCAATPNARKFLEKTLGHHRFIEEKANVESFKTEAYIDVWRGFAPHQLLDIVPFLSAWDNRFEITTKQSEKLVAA